MGLAVAVAAADVPSSARILPDGTHGNGPTEALARWNAFPVTANPRPLVVFDPIEYEVGLDNSAEENGFSRGLWTIPSSLPEGPGTRGGYEVLSARAAAEQIRQSVLGDVDEELDGMTIPPRPIALTSARLVERRFLTDRGSAVLPAWEFEFEPRLEAPTVVLAATGTAVFASPAISAADGVAVVSADGRSLVFRFTGYAPGAGPCEAEYTPLVQESATAVAIGALERSGRVKVGEGCADVGHSREIRVDLDEPLGNRVLISHGRGVPIQVLTPEQEAAKDRAVAEFRDCVAREEAAGCLRKITALGTVRRADLQSGPRTAVE